MCRVFSPEVENLLMSSIEALPLTKRSLRPKVDVGRVRSHPTTLLFPAARHAQAALAGLLLRLGYWDESHQVAQDLHSPEGSYWHAITHRMEPDASNAGYWFRQVGDHSIFADLHRRTEHILKNSGPKHWRLKAAWDPFLFIKWYAEAIDTGGHAEVAARQIQMAEWQLLFEWCTAPNG